MNCHDEASCEVCGRREVITYKCTDPRCRFSFDVPGRYRYFAQGRGHWHVPDDDPAFKSRLDAHRRLHSKPSGFLPVRRQLGKHD